MSWGQCRGSSLTHWRSTTTAAVPDHLWVAMHLGVPSKGYVDALKGLACFGFTSLMLASSSTIMKLHLAHMGNSFKYCNACHAPVQADEHQQGILVLSCHQACRKVADVYLVDFPLSMSDRSIRGTACETMSWSAMSM